MEKRFTLGLLDVILALSDAMDLVSPLVVGHHKRVASISLALSRELALPETEQSALVVAAALHDCGAFSLRDRIDTLDFEFLHPEEHAGKGYHLLRTFAPLGEAARAVRFHHQPWDRGAGRVVKDEEVPRASHVIHLADRVAVLIDEKQPVLEQRPFIVQTVNGHRGTLFSPDVVEAFNRLAERESFWFDAVSPDITAILTGGGKSGSVSLSSGEFAGLIRLFYRIIDFRSPFTATHTSGVHACAEVMADLCGLGHEERSRLSMAACLHDLGKLAVPKEILEKPAPLDHHELTIMRGHPYYGYRILERFPAIRDINTWANFHHERLDGSGYPFHLAGEALSLECRIMAVVDVYTALTETRPYRPALEGRDALAMMDSLAKYGKIDPALLETVRRDHDRLDSARSAAQKAASESYEAFVRHCCPDSAAAGPG